MVCSYYYGDLSDQSSSSCSSSSSEDDEDDERLCSSETVAQSSEQHLWRRCIVHLDIDCFYCQCEELDRNIKSPRPLAIGQKHIIVTCNYEARRYGVKKLQSRDDAMAACPSLWILEGSDLQNYKRHSRAVYEAFRRACKEIGSAVLVSVPVRKGCMDEMMADLTLVVDNYEQQTSPAAYTTADHDTEAPNQEQYSYQNSPFIFGESEGGATELVEDQTGQTTSLLSSNDNNNNNLGRMLPHSRRNVHETYGNDEDRQTCIRRMEIAAIMLVRRICQRIVQDTGFYTTAGISVSPLLAKLASDLNKPKSINLLYPWRSDNLLYTMPLRKLHSVGHRTMRALETCLLQQSVSSSPSTTTSSNRSEKKDVKTVMDLLQVQHDAIARALQSLHAFHDTRSSVEQCEILLQRCRGLDTTQVVDDEGGLPKTVSVENSFRRNTVCTLESVQNVLEDLLHRLPLLVNDRTAWAAAAAAAHGGGVENAYPTTLRVTIRMVDRSLVVETNNEGMKQRKRRRRPFVTKSKQTAMANGKAWIQEKDERKQSVKLKQLVTPLLNQLLSASVKTNSINVTRLNIAVANFQDVVRPPPISSSTGQRTLLCSTPQKRTADLNFVASKRTKVARPIVAPTTTINSSSSSSSGNSTPSITSFRQSSNCMDSKFKRHSMPKRQQLNKMKTTRIDNFFQRKRKT